MDDLTKVIKLCSSFTIYLVRLVPLGNIEVCYTVSHRILYYAIQPIRPVIYRIAVIYSAITQSTFSQSAPCSARMSQ